MAGTEGGEPRVIYDTPQEKIEAAGRLVGLFKDDPPAGWRRALPQDFPEMSAERCVVSFIYGPDHSFMQILIQQADRTFCYNASRLEWGLVLEDQ